MPDRTSSMPPMPELPARAFAGRDGTPLVYYESGEGRTVVLIHGYFSSALDGWVRFGHAAAVAARGFRVVMPDLRGHGASGKPHDPAAYPADVLADDGLALLDHLGLPDYDLAGYSLGGRTVVRMLARGARPRRAVVAGHGIDEIVDPAANGRSAPFFREFFGRLGTFPAGSREARTEAFMRSAGGDPVALLHVLNATAGTPPEALEAIDTPALVLLGDRDARAGDALAAALQNARYATIPGDHAGATITPNTLGETIGDFLADRPARPA